MTNNEKLARWHQLKAELESKDKAVKLLQGHCKVLMDTEGKLAQRNKGHLAGMESAGYYQKQADDMIRQLKKELSDENANFTEEIMNLERQISEAKNREVGMTELYEELYEHHFKEHHTPDYVKIEELENQLAEVRAELASYKAGVEVTGHVSMQERGASVPGLSAALLAYPHKVRVLVLKEAE